MAEPVYPQFGDVVVCKVTKILDYGVFVQLLEFNDLQGFVHISQVSSSWIKNIRNFVKENQIRAAQVVGVDRSKNHVDLSLNKVSAGAQRAKIEAWKQSKRAQKLIEMIAEKNKSTYALAMQEVGNPLLEVYESLFDAFQEIVLGDKAALKLVPQKWLVAVQDVVSKNVEIPQKQTTGVLSLTSYDSDGVEKIKSVLEKARKTADKENVEFFYLGSGKYMVKVTSFDYKSSEKILKKIADTALESMKALKGVATFTKS